MVKKNCSCSKNIEHGQNIFELADGIGMKVVNTLLDLSNRKITKLLVKLLLSRGYKISQILSQK